LLHPSLEFHGHFHCALFDVGVQILVGILYESYHRLGKPFIRSAGPIIWCGTVSKALDTSRHTATRLWCWLFECRSNSLRICTLKHPASDTNPFWRGWNRMCSLSFWSIMPQYNRLSIELIVMGRDGRCRQFVSTMSLSTRRQLRRCRQIGRCQQCQQCRQCQKSRVSDN
jgi:hypothetical protein